MLTPSETIIEIKDERQLKSVCGVTESQLKIIAQEFEWVEKKDQPAQLDYKMFKSEFSTKAAWFKPLKVFVDLGYQGICKDYDGENILIPHEKSRKYQNNPKPALTKEQKQYNKELSKTRILVENAIEGMKRLNILVHPFRNRKPNFMMLLCFVLDYGISTSFKTYSFLYILGENFVFCFFNFIF